MAEDDSNSNLFVRFANFADAVEVSAKTIISILEDDGKEISKKGLAEWLTKVASFHRELSDKLRGTLKPAYENEKAKLIDHYTTEITQLKNTHKEKEDNWKADIRKLETELEEKVKSFDDLNRKLDALMLEKNEVDAQLETLQAEKCTRDSLIQELETRLNALQAEHVGIIASFDNAQEVENELTAKVVELEKEVDRQNEVISYRTYEKMEAIRQLSSSLEHYKSRYEELRKASVSKNKARCFDFLHRPNLQCVNNV